MEEIKFIIPIPPVTKKNSSQVVRTKSGRIMILPSPQYRKYEKKCATFVKPYGIKEKVNVKALYYMPTRRKVDISNLHEALHDVLVKYGAVEDDNFNIIGSTDGSRVLYDKASPRTEIIITSYDE